jgi:hypothetical protein
MIGDGRDRPETHSSRRMRVGCVIRFSGRRPVGVRFMAVWWSPPRQRRHRPAGGAPRCLGRGPRGHGRVAHLPAPGRHRPGDGHDRGRLRSGQRSRPPHLEAGGARPRGTRRRPTGTGGAGVGAGCGASTESGSAVSGVVTLIRSWGSRTAPPTPNCHESDHATHPHSPISLNLNVPVRSGPVLDEMSRW